MELPTFVNSNSFSKTIERPKLIGVLRDIYQLHGVKLWWLLLLMAVVALIEGMSMTLLLPLLSIVGIDGMVGNGIIQSFVNDVLMLAGVSESIPGTLALVLAAFALQAALLIFQLWWMANIERSYVSYWQQRLFKGFMHVRWSFLIKNKQGLLTNAITTEALRLSGAFKVIIQIAATFFVIAVYLIIAITLSWQITLILLLLAMVLFLAVRGAARKNFELGIKITEGNNNLMVHTGEYLSGAKLIKATSTEFKAVEDINNITESLRGYHTWATFIPGLTRSVFEFASIAALCIILVMSYLYLDTPAAHMVLILGLFVRLLPRFNALQQNIQLLNTYLPALVELTKLYDMISTSKECVNKSQDYKEAPSGTLVINDLNAGFDGVNILKGVSSSIPETGLVGIVGESGSGKSTFVHSLLGLSELQGGDINIGRSSINEMPLPLWRESIGYVPQETILFHRSIWDNITWGLSSATEEQVIVAAKKAEAHDFISELPEGYHTIIGDQGVRLSGGQRQRLGIARALLTQPKFLLLDEATSALDSSSEKAILDTLQELRGELCIISIAHRLSTVRHADKIIVMSDGRVQEEGSWNSLMSKKGSLYQLAQKQHMVT